MTEIENLHKILVGIKYFGGPRVILNWAFFKQNLYEGLTCRRRGSGGAAPVNMSLTRSVPLKALDVFTVILTRTFKRTLLHEIN
jgi:hypothetical protein